MIRLHDNPFSPFARKVRMVLDHKGLSFERIDALALAEHERLARVNPRAEVPVLEDDGFVVANSSHIVAYLEDAYPDPPVYPADARRRAAARAWELAGDTVPDSILHDISLWIWPTHHRTDAPPEGLIEAGRDDLLAFVDRMERALPEEGFLCGDLSVADLALFPHVSSLKPLGIALSPETFPRVAGWIRRIRSVPAVARDLAYVKQMAVEKFVKGPSPYEAEKVVWRGDRIEWLFAKGFARWWFGELEAGRAVVPSWNPPTASGSRSA